MTALPFACSPSISYLHRAGYYFMYMKSTFTQHIVFGLISFGPPDVESASFSSYTVFSF